MFKGHDHFIDVLGKRIYYMTLGHGEPFLFIHGHRSDSKRFLAVLYELAKKYTVYAPDLPGYGQSEELSQWHTIENNVPYVLGLIDKLNLSRFSLGGLSMGATIAVLIAQRIPNRIRELCLLGPIYDYRCLKIPQLNNFICRLLIFIFRKSPGLIWLVNKLVRQDRIFAPFMARTFLPEERKPEIIKYELKQWRLMSIRIWAEAISSALKFTIKDKKPLNIPTLLVFSKHDQYLKVDESIKGFRELFPNNKLFLLDLKHHAPRGELTEEILKGFGNVFQQI
jgi:pimeloyl-ACP methyl ester carboxylesterase